MSNDNPHKDLELLDLFTKAISKAEKSEPNEPGAIKFLVMPDRIITAMRDKVAYIDYQIFLIGRDRDATPPTLLVQAELEIAQCKKELASLKEKKCDTTAKEAELSRRNACLEVLKKRIEKYDEECKRLSLLRDRYEDLVLKVLEMSLKG